MKTLLIALTLTTALTATLVGAETFEQAPPSFDYNGKRIVASNFESMTVRYRFDVPGKSATAVARIEFKVREAGYPMLDLHPNATAVTLDGVALLGRDLAPVNSPDGKTALRFINRQINDQATHTVEIAYTVQPGSLSFSSKAVNFGFFMSDLTDRGLLERYAPANFEFDAFRLTVESEIVGATVAQQIFSNGTVSELGRNHWRIEYPEHFNSSSPYLHLTDGMRVAQGTYVGMAARIPVTAYARTQALADRGLSDALVAMRAHEGTFGASIHPTLTLFITARSGDGGMEYCGATTTDLEALSHELAHFWYARGVQPADGNSGWIDESVASWQDENYVRANSNPSGSPVNLSNRGTYVRSTAYASYSSGMRFLSGLDYMFAARGGLRPMLKEIYGRKQKQRITTAQFQAMLEELSQSNLSAYFDRYVYGRARGQVVAEQIELADVLSARKPSPESLLRK